MTVVLFDTQAFVKRLTAAGMPEAQAEVLADTRAQLIDERLATKTDVAALAAKLDDFASKGELRLEANIQSAKAETIEWRFGTIGFQTVIMLGAVLALAKVFH